MKMFFPTKLLDRKYTMNHMNHMNHDILWHLHAAFYFKEVESSHSRVSERHNPGSTKCFLRGERRPSMRSLAVACVVALVAANAAGGAPEFFHTDGAWAMLKDGDVRTWGDPGRGGDSSSVRDMSGVDMSGIEHGVQSVVATKSAFAALKADGSVISWGKASEGGDSRVNLDSVVKLAASAYAFAALRADGGVVFWGKLSADESEAEGNDGNAAQHSLEAKPLEPSHSQGEAEVDEADEALQDLEILEELDSLDSGVVDVIASSEAFACIKEDGTVYTWDGDLLKKVYDGDNPVVEVVGGLSSFAALRKDGSVLTWGHPEFGGDSSAVLSHLQSGVLRLELLRLERRSIFDRGFIAWKANSTAVIWGHNKKGVPLESQIVRAEQVQLKHGIQQLLKSFKYVKPPLKPLKTSNVTLNSCVL